jgi:diguanylate cyclase (GGDEF)-like protein/PAS domain S-box-containing protein
MKPLNILRRLDLKATIAIFTVALFVSTILTLAHDLDKEVRENVREVVAAQQSQTVEHVATSLNEAVVLRVNALTDLALLVDAALMASPARLHAFLAEHMPLHRFFNAGLVVISPQGIGLADLPNLDGREGASFGERDFFREVMATGEPFVGKPIIGRFTQKPVLSIAVPIKNPNNEVIGVLMGANRIVGGGLLSETLPVKPRSNGDIHVISLRDGMFVSSTDSTRIMQPAPVPGVDAMFDRYREGYEGSGTAVDSQGVGKLSSAKRVASTGWLVVATLPASIAFASLTQLQWEIYKDAAMASAIVALLLWLFLESQISPLNRSARIIDAMADGREALSPLRLEGSREIRRLLESFNKLQKHITDQRQSLQEGAEQMRLAASVFEGTSEAILIASPENRIISVNRAFCRMTGYEESELIGKNPRLLQSGRHDQGFYQKMWSSVLTTGQWHGEIWNRRKNGQTYPERITISALHDDAGNVLRYIAIAADITSQKQAEAVIWQQANHDLLTSLPNRRLLQKLAQEALDKARFEGLSLAMLHIDLDHFTEVNDTLGHAIGDQMIMEAGNRISACVEPDSDVVAHLGGDEFLVLFGAREDCSVRAERAAEDILRAIATPFSLGSETAYISASIGMTCYPDDAEAVADLLVNANQAKMVAKGEGRNCYCRFDASMKQLAQTRMQLANDMRGALSAGQFEVHYQPIVDLATGDVVKAEALLRWNHPERGLVSPVQFIPIAEETGLIGEIGDWVFREASQTAGRWCATCGFSGNAGCNMAESGGIDAGCPHQISINKSPRQFFVGNTERAWIDSLRERNIPAGCVVIEITEGLLLDRHPEVMQKFMAFRDAGIQVALDDFGTGYSAMSYLKKFDIDYLKIDQSFVRDIVTDPSDRAIVEAVIAMAHKLGMKVVAEGVETLEQRGILTEAGCDFGQGYLFAKPMPASQFEILTGVARE